MFESFVASSVFSAMSHIRGARLTSRSVGVKVILKLNKKKKKKKKKKEC